MKSDTSAGSWLKFFTDAGIDTPQAEHYAVTFSKNQIQLDMLPEINKDYLMDMGILLLGHVIAILRHAKAVYADEVKNTALPKSAGSIAIKENTAVKSNKTTMTSKSVAADEGPTVPVKRKSTVVQLNSTIESDEPKTKVRKNLCDSSDDITSKRIKPASSILSNDSSGGVFKRLGSEISHTTAEPSSTATLISSPSTYSSNESGVFARLGGKTVSPQTAVSVTTKVLLPTTTTTATTTTRTITSKIPGKKSIIRTRLDKPRLVSAPYMDTVLEKRNIPYSPSITRPQDKQDIKRRLGLPAKSITAKALSNSPPKRVSFGQVYQKLIPIVKKPTYINGSQSSFSFQRNSIGASALGLSSKMVSLGSSKGVFSRLGVK